MRARASGKGDKTRRVGDALKVDVVDPRYIVAVGIVIVEEESAESAACRLDGLDLSIEATGFLARLASTVRPAISQRPMRPPAGT